MTLSTAERAAFELLARDALQDPLAPGSSILPAPRSALWGLHAPAPRTMSPWQLRECVWGPEHAVVGPAAYSPEGIRISPEARELSTPVQLARVPLPGGAWLSVAWAGIDLGCVRGVPLPIEGILAFPGGGGRLLFRAPYTARAVELVRRVLPSLMEAPH